MKKIFLSICLIFSIFNKVLAYDKRLILKNEDIKLVGLLGIPDNFNKNKKYPIVIIMHGLGANKNSYLVKNISTFLIQNGIPTLRFDFNAHGESSGRDIDMTVSKEVEDAKQFIEYAKNLNWVSNIILLGHSQGGLVAGLVASYYKKTTIPYLIQLAPAGDIIYSIKKNGIFANVKLFDPNNIPEQVRLNENFSISKKYLEDIENIHIYEDAKKYKGNVLLIHGDNDIVVDNKYSLKYKKKYKNCEYHLIKGADHNFYNNFDKISLLIYNFINKNNLIQ